MSCYVDLWPLTLKLFSAMPITHMTIICDKFHWNRCTEWNDIATSHHGRPEDSPRTYAFRRLSLVAKAKKDCLCPLVMRYSTWGPLGQIWFENPSAFPPLLSSSFRKAQFLDVSEDPLQSVLCACWWDESAFSSNRRQKIELQAKTNDLLQFC